VNGGLEPQEKAKIKSVLLFSDDDEDDLKNEPTDPPRLERQNAMDFETGVPSIDDIFDEYQQTKHQQKSSKPKPLKANKPEKPQYEDIGAIMPAQRPENKQDLYHKITLYHKFFPKEVKGLKLKKDASIDELHDYIKACDATIMASDVNNFLQFQILSAIRVVERLSAIAGNVKLPFIRATIKCNITSTADKLQEDPEFGRLCNLLFIKYNMFSTIPPEFQLMFLILKTAMLARVENSLSEKNMREFLNQEI
jgi:hypothetical protein